MKRLKELEKENERLRKAVSDLTLDKLILRQALASEDVVEFGAASAVCFRVAIEGVEYGGVCGLQPRAEVKS